MKTNKFKFEDYDEMAEYLFEDMNALDDDKLNEVVVIALGWECAEILASIFSVASELDVDIFIEDIELQTSGREWPYIITISEDGGIWCEPATTDDGKMLWIDSPVAYARTEFMVNADHNLAENHIIHEYSLEDDDFGDEDDDCEAEESNNCFMPLTDEDDLVHGFQFNLEDDGKCFCGVYCSCDPITTQEESKDLLDFYNIIADTFLMV